ncbi:DUF3813 domain-containing protein [Bacillus methanolicus]|uniref:DUF3813 domain-containing protein n=1 Tax=Bacillus methanolicus TaxID=1471 RepID=UPI002380B80C|nr:DUF3813 domain-containing protein [Bacillus methanolicus]MDE3838189.1 DUF3813 domain-containing protein [Bacillus methanolicus]
MGNRLFQEAKKFVNLAKNAETSNKQEALARAKNAISSAYANSTIAEQRQLQELQNELENIK